MNHIFHALRTFIGGLCRLIGYLYLSRVPLLGLALLAGLPWLALGPLRTLVIGAYDAGSFREAFWIGLALCALGATVFLTARVVWTLAKRRFAFDLGTYGASIEIAWGCAVGLALFYNAFTVVRVSNPSVWVQVAEGLAASGLVGVIIGLFTVFKTPDVPAWLESRIVWTMEALGLDKERGYLQLFPKVGGKSIKVEEGQTSVIVFTCVLFALYFLLMHLPVPAPALVSVVMVSAGVVLVCSGIAFYLDRYRVPVLIVIAGYCAITACWWQNDHFYRLWPAPSTDPKELTPRAVLHRAAEDGSPIVIVASAGGGIQATAWTTAALRKIDKELHKTPGLEKLDFPHSIRLMSGVSGGSVGELFYAMAVPLKTDHPFRKANIAAGNSGLAPAMRGLLRDDMFRALAPFAILNGSNIPMSIYRDRGFELEQAWIRNAREQFPQAPDLANATLLDWGRDALSGVRPALIFNSTLVESGERFAISTVPTSPKHSQGVVGSCEFLHRYKANLAMTTAARLSATFPFVSPTARPGVAADATQPGQSLPGPEFWEVFPRGGNYLHAVDGGYYENSGVIGAVKWVDDALTEMVERHEKLPSKILFIELNAFPLEAPLNETEQPPPDAPAIDRTEYSRGTLYDLTSPLTAMMQVRNSGQKAFAQIGFEMFQSRWAHDHNTPVDIEQARIFYNVDPARWKPLHIPKPFVGPDVYNQPLSWHLRACEKQDIAAHLRNLRDTKDFETIRQFFHK